MTNDDRENEWWSVQWTMVFLCLFISLSFNYVYSLYLQQMIIRCYEVVVRLADKQAIDIHFVRLFIIAAFGADQTHHHMLYASWRDLLSLVLILVPLFILGLRYWTAPSYLVYGCKLNGLLCPVSLLPLFFSDHLDIKLMAGLVYIMNFLPFWGHCDPGYDNYHYNNGRYSSRRYSNRRPTKRQSGSSSSDDEPDYSSYSHRSTSSTLTSRAIDASMDVARQMTE